MHAASYLPSSQFSLIAGSIIASGALIIGAQYLTAPSATPSTLLAATEERPSYDWKSALDEVQADAPALPASPSQASVAALLEGAKTSNITDTVARSLLINVTDAGSQGLGSDIPTQERLITEAMKQVPPVAAKKTYSASTLETTGDSKDEQHTYGNKVIQALGRHTTATSQAVLYAVSLATDNNDPKALDALPPIAREYEALVADLADIPVPKTLAPLHAQILNDLGLTAASVTEMKLVLTDPVRGLYGLQRYQQMLGETGRVFTSLAELLNKNGILFSKDEPGAAWAVFTSV